MPRFMDIKALQKKTMAGIGNVVINTYLNAMQTGVDYHLLRWIAQMSAVEVNAIWERYVEERLVAALNNEPYHFLINNELRGVDRISVGFARYIVRSGRQYFDFRSSSDLIARTDRWLTKSRNPFRRLSEDDRMYVDTLAAIRNCVVHGSQASTENYKRMLRRTYNVKAAPKPGEFLNAIDYRRSSENRYQPRLVGLAMAVAYAVARTY